LVAELSIAECDSASGGDLFVLELVLREAGAELVIALYFSRVPRLPRCARSCLAVSVRALATTAFPDDSVVTLDL
jgi:hypothetical protein